MPWLFFLSQRFSESAIFLVQALHVDDLLFVSDAFFLAEASSHRVSVVFQNMAGVFV